MEKGRRPSVPAYQKSAKLFRPATFTHGVRRSRNLIALQPLLTVSVAVLITPLVQ